MTTYSPTNGAQITGHLNGGDGFPSSYSPGDIIQIPNGYHTLTAAIQPAAGRLAGVTLQGTGRQLARLAGAAWEVDIAGGSMTVQNLTISLAGVGKIASPNYGSMDLVDGDFSLSFVTIIGPNTSGNLLTFVADDFAVDCTMSRCRVRRANLDCLSTKAPGGQAIGEASLLTVTNCQLALQGDAVGNQCVTSHDHFPITMDHGALLSVGSRVAAEPDAVSPLLLQAVSVRNGSVDSKVTGWWRS